MAGVDRRGDDVLPALVEECAGELRILDGPHREDDVLRGDRGTVRPSRIGSQHEGVAATVRADLPARGKASLDRPGRQDSDERLEEQRIEVIRPGGGLSEERVQRAELAHHALHVGAARSGRLGRQDDATEHEGQDR